MAKAVFEPLKPRLELLNQPTVELALCLRIFRLVNFPLGYGSAFMGGGIWIILITFARLRRRIDL